MAHSLDMQVVTLVKPTMHIIVILFIDYNRMQRALIRRHDLITLILQITKSVPPLFAVLIYYKHKNSASTRLHYCNIFTIYSSSLSTVVLNSRDLHEKTWRPTFTHLDNMTHNILYLKTHW